MTIANAANDFAGGRAPACCQPEPPVPRWLSGRAWGCVAEESEGPETGAQASGAGVDPAAMALALGGASRSKADAFLDDQRALIADQRHHLREQFKRLKMGVISDRLSITLKLLTGIVGLAFAAGLALMIWDAAHADWWFARAAAAGPSLPVADADWGQPLLERGQPDAAIAKFTLANQKGPHFANPLEGWDEALMAKKDLSAAAKFAEAEKFAPDWGKLHLKWGEALAFAGKKDEAQKQFALAAGLDLSADNKAELAKAGGQG
jgi:hypothetical protein